MADRKLNYEINLNINKTSVDNLKKSLSDVERNLKQAIATGGPSEEFEKSLKAAQDLKGILNSSWNHKLNQLDLSKVNEQLIKSYGSISNFKEALESTSSIGAKAYNDFSKIVLNTNLQLAQSNKLLDDMADTLGKTIKWGIASRVMNNMVGSIEKAWSYTVKLDKSLNDIRIVTNKSAEEMDRFAITANKAAQSLGASTRDYTEASLIYYQQGLSDQEAQKRAEITLKAANVTGQSAQQVSEQLTAVWNGYNVAIQESELYVDKLAAVAAATAADLEELSTGMSKVASTAATMGVDIDQLSAQMATIISVTRQAPESVGTALRTIYARMGDIKAGLDSETTLGNYTSKMAQLGVNVLNANGELRDMGEVIEEVGSRWTDLSREQQVALAQTMAGTRQYNNLLALFENWDDYTSALETSANAAGTLNEQQEIYMESTEAHLQKMRTEAEKTYDILFDTKTVNSFIDAFTWLNSVFNSFLKGLGGGMNDFVYFGSLLTNIFSNQLADGIDNAIQKIEIFKKNKSAIAMLKAINKEGYSDAFYQNIGYVKDATSGQFERTSQLLKLQPSMRTEDFNTLNTLSQEIAYYEEIAELKREAQDSDESEAQILNKQIESLAEQNNKLKEKINLKEKITRKDIEEMAGQTDIFTSSEINKFKNITKDKRALTKDEEKEILNIEEKAQLRIEQILNRKIDAQKHLEELEEQNISQLDYEVKKRQEIYDAAVKQAERQKAISDVVSGFSSMVQIGTISIGVLKTLNDETATIEEKLLQIGTVFPSLIYGAWQLSKAIMANPMLLLGAAAIAGTVAVIAATANEVSLLTDRTRVLNKQLKENKKAVEDATNAYDDLKTTISNYSSGIEGISKLKEGTLEFYEAIAKTNEEAQKLIEAFDLEAGSQFQIDSNGLIKIDENALQQGMFKQSQDLYQKQLQQSITQYSINQKERDKEIDKLTRQFQQNVSNKTPGGYGISYEQAKQMIDEFTLEENEVTISIGQLQKALEDNDTENFEDLCTLITKEMSEVKATINEKNAKEAQEAELIGSEAIRAYGSQEEVEAYNKLPANLRKLANQTLGGDITAIQKMREENNLTGRNITSTFEQAIGLYGGRVGNIISSVPFMGLGAVGGKLSDLSTRIRQEQINYNETQALNKEVVTGNKGLNDFNDKINEYLRDAAEQGFGTTQGGQYIAQARYESEINDKNKVSKEVLNKLTLDELKYLNDLNIATDEYNKRLNDTTLKTDEWGRTQARQTADLEEYQNALKVTGEELGVSTKTMELYGDAAINAGKADARRDATTAEQVKKLASFNKAFNEAIKLYKDNKDALEDYAEAMHNKVVPSLEAAEGAAAISEKLEEMGLSLSGQQLADNLETINTLLTGTEEEAKSAYNELSKLSYINILEGFDTTAFDNLKISIEDFANYIATLQPGAALEGNYAKALRKMINDSKMTKEQITELLGNLNIQAPNMDAHLKEHTEHTKGGSRKIKYTGHMPFMTAKGKVKNKEINYEVTEEIEDQTFTYYTLGKGQTFKTSESSGARSFTKSPSNSGGGGEAKEVDQNTDEADIYHEVDTQIKKVENSMKQLQSQTKKLVGADLIENLNKQWQELNTQVQNYNEKLRIAQSEQAGLRNKLAVQGVSFNPDGTIGNYVQAFQAQQAQLNNVINYYNSLSSEGQKSYQKVLDAAQESFKEFQKDMDRYDTLVSDFIPGLYESIQDAIDKQIDIQIEQFDMEIEIRLKMSEAERDWNEFKKKIIDGIEDDDILGNAMAKLVDFSSYYKEDNTGAAQALRKQIDDTLKELYQMDEGQTSRVYGDNRAKALEDLKKYYDELRKQMVDILNLQKEIHKSYIDMMNEAQDKFDEQIKSYSIINDLIEHDKDVISLIYGKESYHQLSNFYDKQQLNYNAQLDFQRQQVEFWKEQMDAAEAGTEAWDEAKEKWVAATKELNSLIETSIQNLQDKYLNTINAIFQDLNNKVTDNLGLDYVEEEWNLINKNADQYLDTINSLYGIQALENKYLDAINDTDNITAQKQLKKIMDEELNNLRERDKLTQYDIERANRKYEIALKQIALEEAQQNKTQLRLRRDSQGNYRYEYISDLEEVNKLQNDLDDLYNSLYNFDKENYANNLNQLYDVWNEFQEKMAEAAQINDPEARAERELLIQEQYGDLINGLVEQNETIRGNLYDSAFDDLARLYDKDKNSFLEMTQVEQDAIMNDLIPYWDAGIQHMADTFVGEGGFVPVCKDAFDELHDATETYENDLREIEQVADISFSNINNGIDETINRTQELLKNNDELINSYKEEMNAIGGVVDELDKLVEKYNESTQAAKDAEEAAYNYWSEQQRQAAEQAAKDQAEKEKKAAAAAATPTSVTPVQTIAPTANMSGGDGIPRVGDMVDFINGVYHGDSYGGGASGAVGRGGKVRITIVKEDGRPYPIHIATLNGGPLGWLSRSQISGYDTGGYTGEWGNTGRLALLHQKELVLNKEDTQNLLNAVNVMRVITNSIGAKILDRLAVATANNSFTNGLNGALEQNVHIEAQFPNVKNSYEIENALNNLINSAAQRVQSKER